MADNSKADQIVDRFVSELSALPSLKIVTRRPPLQDEFEEMATSQLPIAVVMGGLPTVTSQVPRKTNFKSTLPVSIRVVILDNINPNKTMMSIADDIWTALMNLPADDHGAYFDGLVYSFDFVPVQVIDVAPPYVSFRYDIEASYIHTNRSI